MEFNREKIIRDAMEDLTIDTYKAISPFVKCINESNFARILAVAYFSDDREVVEMCTKMKLGAKHMHAVLKNKQGLLDELNEEYQEWIYGRNY